MNNDRFPALSISNTLVLGQVVFDVSCGRCTGTVGQIPATCDDVLCSKHGKSSWDPAIAM